MGDKIDAENVDDLGFPITCGHLDDRDKFGDIPLEQSADMAACKECYIRMTPAEIIAEQEIKVPDGVEPGELLNRDLPADVAEKLEESEREQERANGEDRRRCPSTPT